jgi:hypothetical protein
MQRKLGFTFDQLRLRLGPKWLKFPLKAGQLGTKCAALHSMAGLCRAGRKFQHAVDCMLMLLRCMPHAGRAKTTRRGPSSSSSMRMMRLQ